MKTDPIGFLDSGVGGLTVVKEALRQLPHEDIVFIGDQARLPYGPRPADQVARFTWELTQFLLQKKIKMLVIACNTATAEALPLIKQKLSIPVVGVIVPGTRAAIRKTVSGRIGVIATEGTTRSQAYVQALKKRNDDLQIFSLAAPKFVPLVESNQYATPLAQQVVAETLQPLLSKYLDTLILGCTHYPLLRPLIQATMGPDVTLIDSGAEAVSEVSVLLDYFNIDNPNHARQRQTTYYTTAAPALFDQVGSAWLNLTDLKAQHIDLKKELKHEASNCDRN